MIETNAWALTGYSDYPEPPAEAVRDLPEYGDRDLWPDEKRCCNCDVIDYSYTFTKNLCDHCLCETKKNKDYRAWFVFANIGDFADFIKNNPIESFRDMEKRFEEFIEDDLDLFAEFVEETLNQWGRA